MTSPYEHGNEQEKKLQAKRFRELSEKGIDDVLKSIEIIVEEGSYNVSVLEDLEKIRHWIKKVKHGNTVSG